jgi:flagellar basal body-associated protein FliL
MVILILIMIVVLIAGSIYALARPSGSDPLFRIGGSPASTEEQAGAVTNDGVSIFAGIGRLRIPLANSSTLILSIAFPYPADDRGFTEELAVKIGEFRAIAGDYFSSLPSEKLLNLDEETAKTEILRSYNANLRLGKIRALYFNDLMIID